MKQILNKLLLASMVSACLISGSTAIADSSIGAATFNDDGELLKPEGFRKWVFLGAPLTPNGLNNGSAPFPEFHLMIRVEIV